MGETNDVVLNCCVSVIFAAVVVAKTVVVVKTGLGVIVTNASEEQNFETVLLHPLDTPAHVLVELT